MNDNHEEINSFTKNILIQYYADLISFLFECRMLEKVKEYSDDIQSLINSSIRFLDLIFQKSAKKFQTSITEIKVILESYYKYFKYNLHTNIKPEDITNIKPEDIKNKVEKDYNAETVQDIETVNSSIMEGYDLSDPSSTTNFSRDFFRIGDNLSKDG